MENDLLVSIVSITYNHEKYISFMIDGVLKQETNFDFELIIADDCSSDNTRAIVKKYIDNYPYGDRIKYFKQKNNLGIHANYKSAIEKCSGKYIAICEGDDYWTDPFKLQKQVEFLENHEGYSMCFTNSIIVDENNNIVTNNRVNEKYRKDITQAEILSGFVPPTNTVVYRNELLKTIVAEMPKITNGDYYNSVLMANCGKIGYLNLNTAAYRIHNLGSWSNLSDEIRKISYTKTLVSLRGKVQKSLEQMLERLISSNLSGLNELNRKDEFLDNNYWTPQTAMLRSIRDFVLQVEGEPQNALSVDKNTTLERILLRKWPGMELTITKWPEYDAQNLHQFKDATFDIVFSHQVMEHIPKPWNAAKELVRVLKRGGIGIHTTCAYNPRHGYPEFKDYYRFLPDGLAELFEGVDILLKGSWGSKQALIYNLAIDDGNGQLGGRRFVEALAKHNDEDYPWHTWIIFQKKI